MVLVVDLARSFSCGVSAEGGAGAGTLWSRSGGDDTDGTASEVAGDLVGPASLHYLSIKTQIGRMIISAPLFHLAWVGVVFAFDVTFPRALPKKKRERGPLRQSLSSSPLSQVKLHGEDCPNLS